ncbi:hypothetical protein Efla_001348 [Eimeria flavescens]
MSCNPTCELHDVSSPSSCVVSSYSVAAGQPLKQRKTAANLAKEFWSLENLYETSQDNPLGTAVSKGWGLRGIEQRVVRMLDGVDSRARTAEAQVEALRQKMDENRRLLEEPQGEEAEGHRWRDRLTRAHEQVSTMTECGS